MFIITKEKNNTFSKWTQTYVHEAYSTRELAQENLILLVNRMNELYKEKIYKIEDFDIIEIEVRI